MLNSILEDMATELKIIEHIATKGYVIALNITIIGGTEFLYPKFNPAWRKYYEKNRLQFDDPVVIWAFKNKGDIRWSDINIPDFLSVFKKAQAYNMNYGAVFSRTTDDKVSLLTVARDDRELTNDELSILSSFWDKITIGRIPFAGLTKAELEVLHLLSKGYNFPAISEKLKISLSGIKKRSKSATTKLGAQNTTEAVAKAIALSYIDFRT